MNYNDEYPTCQSTYTTLCVYLGEIDPDDITSAFGITPSRTQRKGERRSPKSSTLCKINGWFLSTKTVIDSRDSRRHLDWLLDQMMPKIDVVHDLIRRGVEIHVSCFWMSASGHGGPMVSVRQSRCLADLGVELWYDFYVGNDEDIS